MNSIKLDEVLGENVWNIRLQSASQSQLKVNPFLLKSIIAHVFEPYQ